MYAKRTPQLSTNNYQLSTVSELLTDKPKFTFYIPIKVYFIFRKWQEKLAAGATGGR
jgi:hypothetical protein